jgi:hypothetical protein
MGVNLLFVTLNGISWHSVILCKNPQKERKGHYLWVNVGNVSDIHVSSQPPVVLFTLTRLLNKPKFQWYYSVISNSLFSSFCQNLTHFQCHQSGFLKPFIIPIIQMQQSCKLDNSSVNFLPLVSLMLIKEWNKKT